MSLIKLFLIFVKIGAILLGGGYVILPIMNNEFVEKRQIIEYSELVDYFALSQSLPGIIAANMSMFIGYKLKGFWGAATAIAGVTFVPFWSIVCLSSVINILMNNIYLQGALKGVGIAIIALILLTIREMWQKSEKNSFFYIIFILTLASLTIVKLTPVQTILVFVSVGTASKIIGGKK